MKRFRSIRSRWRAIAVLNLATLGFAQSPEISITNPAPVPVVGPLLKPFQIQRRIVSPATLTNTPRLESLVRAGNLYLSVQDVIALVLENNIDIAIQRYGPPLAREVLRRAEGGGFLRSVGVPIYTGPASVSLAGVSANSVGLAESGSGVGSGGGIVIQIGTPPPNLDPYLFAYVNFAHNSTPLSNTLLNQVTSLQNDNISTQLGYGQSFLTGTSAQLTYYTYRSSLNSPANSLNPYTQGALDLYITQNLLQGLSKAVNNRNIRVAKNNMKVTDLQVRLQVITTVSAVLNLYWDLVSFNEALRIQRRALVTAEKLLEDNKKQVTLGTMPSIELTRASAEVSFAKENLLIAETNVAQQETVLKNALSRSGVASPWLDDVHVIPLDHIVVPDKEELPPMAELLQQALASRPELERTRVNIQSTIINLGGTRNALMPNLQAFAEFTNNGLTGELNALANGDTAPPDPYLLGGYSNMLAQIFRRNYPNYSAGFSLNIPFRNRAAQGDYVADQLALRQAQLQMQRSSNQVRVDVKNAVIGLQQARARYETALATRVLAQQSVEAEENRFKFGQSTIALVVQSRRDLATTQSAEVESMANYTHARIAFDDAVGQTLEKNGISLEEAATGRVRRVSTLSDELGKPNQQK